MTLKYTDTKCSMFFSRLSSMVIILGQYEMCYDCVQMDPGRAFLTSELALEIGKSGVVFGYQPV